MKKLLITGYFGAGNFGDDMMLEAFCKEIKNINPEIDITILKLFDRPFNVNLGKDIKVINHYKIKKFKRAIFKFQVKKYDMFLWIGGTCFTDQDADGCYVYMKLAQEKNVKIGYIGVGIGTLKLKERIEKAKYLINTCDFISFRDKNSYEYAKAINNKCKNLYLTEDLAYLFVKNLNYKKDNIKKDNKRRIVVSWRNLTGYMEEEKEMKLIDNLITFLKSISEENIETELNILPLDDRKDNEKNKVIFDKMKCCESKMLKVNYKENLTPLEKTEVILNSDLNISGRLHGIFISEINNIKTIAISYSIKIDEFLKSIGKIDDMIKVSNIEQESLKKVYSLNNNMVSKKQVEENIKKSKENIERFNEFINRL